ncbi:MAG TPA: hypothetical protein VHL31_10770 [Geminicoccus sp.]|jgi:hypothetical protein|uniref:hypothetical protein n=1 Tax=Geminicoccus sp. TaxID=2024832 RepID=UPI002E376AC1|nr:hypothetical protein [Geminicoccus sp.]HEX2526763.1 hypothetical protein [Geminicoccus sp.]
MFTRKEDALVGKVVGDHYEVARNLYDQRRRERREVAERLEAAKMALSSHGYDRDGMAPVVRAKTEPFADMSPARLMQLIVELEDEVRAAQTAMVQAKAAFEAVRAVEARRRAAEATPAHVEIVREIADLVQKLSMAVARERAIRGSLVEVEGGHLLPDASAEIGTLADQSSPLARWNSRLLMAGALA